MSIATKTGDDGTTSLSYGRRVKKTHPRVVAYGAVDELNAALGMARSLCDNPHYKSMLELLQEDLIRLAGGLSVDDQDHKRLAESPTIGVHEEQLARLENWLYEMEEEGVKFEGFVLPGSDPFSAALHVARTVCRRAELEVLLLKEAGFMVTACDQKYLNRLADFLWLLAEHD